MPDSAHQLKVLLITDVFPPGSGGSGWSTYYLGKALAERGHAVRVLRPRYGERVARAKLRIVEYGGLPVEELLIPEAPGWAKKLGIARARSETVARRLLARRAYQTAISAEADVLHGQHMVSALAACDAARRARREGARVVSLATVRDYWPLCPNSTRLFKERDEHMFECPDCHVLTTYLSCTRHAATFKALDPRPSTRWLRTLAASRALARCDCVIAVSEYMRAELARSRRVSTDRLVTIPNLVDLPSMDRAFAGPWPLRDISLTDPYLLYVGKLDANKGAHLLVDVVAESDVRMPVVLAGDGPLREMIASDARARGLDFRFCDWLDNDAVLILMRHARALLFPSAWQEPLSRVLLEGCAAGAAIVALDTGGTGDILTHLGSGWLAHDMSEFSEGIRQVVSDDALAQRLRSGARSRAEIEFAAPVVSAKVESLYRTLLDRQVSV